MTDRHPRRSRRPAPSIARPATAIPFGPRLVLAAALTLGPGPGIPARAEADGAAARPPTGPKAWAKVASTSSQPSLGDAIRQRGFDGDEATAYRSAGPARAGDHLTFTFDAPSPARKVELVTGTPDGSEPLVDAAVEVMEEGKTFRKVATTDAKGRARADLNGRPVRAVRVKVGRDLGHPMIVRELAVDSARVRPFRHPVEFAVDCSDAPQMQGWTEETARLCEQWYDTLNDVMTLTDTHPPGRVTLAMRRDYDGVAEAGGDRITGSVRFFTDRPEDRGAFIHETVHVIQQYPHYGTRRAPAWLVEGMDDYIRFFIYEPGQAGPVSPDDARYDGSYRVTATFLDFASRTFDGQLIPKLDRILRAGEYRPESFREITGKPLAELNDRWRVSMGLPPVPRAAKVDYKASKPVGAIQGGEKGTAFRDEPKGRLARVTVAGGWWIDSIACAWDDGRLDVEGRRHGGDGGSEAEVTLEPGESLVEVSGIVREDGDRDLRLGSEVIGTLTFRTTKRTVGPIGEATRGRKFSLKAPRGQEISGFQGRSDRSLDALGIICRPIP